jgi:hypothetical protein
VAEWLSGCFDFASRVAHPLELSKESKDVALLYLKIYESGKIDIGYNCTSYMCWEGSMSNLVLTCFNLASWIKNSISFAKSMALQVIFTVESPCFFLVATHDQVSRYYPLVI